MSYMDPRRREKLLDPDRFKERLALFLADRGKMPADLKGLQYLKGIDNYLKGIQFPGYPALVALADACSSTLVALIGYIDPEPDKSAAPLTKQEEHLLTEFRKLDDRARNTALNSVKALRELLDFQSDRIPNRERSK